MHARNTTFLFTDIEGSTALWERDADEMAVRLADHDRRLYRAIHAHGGRVFAAGGDGVAAAFGQATDAMRAALDVQRAMRVLDLSIRVGMHTGDAIHRHGNFVGPAVNRAARITQAARGGQVLVSSAVLDAATTLCGIELTDAGMRELAGIAEPMQSTRSCGAAPT
jgi:class 3 adenylate cyclase